MKSAPFASLLFLVHIAIFAAEPNTGAAAPNKPDDLPRLVGFMSSGETPTYVLADPLDRRATEFLGLGAKYGDYKLLAHENSREGGLILGRGGQTFTVFPEPQAALAKAAPLAVSREQARAQVGKWLDGMKAEVAKNPYFRPYDPNYETTLPAEVRADIARRRAAASARNQRHIVMEGPEGPMPITIDKTASQQIRLQAMFKNLTPDDWAPIDREYEQTVAEQFAVSLWQQSARQQKHP